MEKQVNVNLEPQEGVLIIREGQAEPIRIPEAVNIQGTLKAPFQYINSSKVSRFNPSTSHLEVNREKGTLTLVLQENNLIESNHIKDTIFGALKEFSALSEFKINTDHKFDNFSLVRLLKKMKFYFKNVEQHAKFLSDLNNFSADIQTKIKDARDNGGNSIKSVESVVSTARTLSFVLEIPLFKGYPKVAFNVEVCLDATDSAVKFYLESSELFELIDQKKDEYLDAEIKLFEKSFNLSVVEVA